MEIDLIMKSSPRVTVAPHHTERYQGNRNPSIFVNNGIAGTSTPNRFFWISKRAFPSTVPKVNLSRLYSTYSSSP